MGVLHSTHTHGCMVPWSDATTPIGAGGLGVCRPESGSTRTDVSLAVWLPTGLIDQYADSLSLSPSLPSCPLSLSPSRFFLNLHLSFGFPPHYLFHHSSLFPTFDCSTSHISSVLVSFALSLSALLSDRCLLTTDPFISQPKMPSLSSSSSH